MFHEIPGASGDTNTLVVSLILLALFASVVVMALAVIVRALATGEPPTR